MYSLRPALVEFTKRHPRGRLGRSDYAALEGPKPLKQFLILVSGSIFSIELDQRRRAYPLIRVRPKSNVEISVADERLGEGAAVRAFHKGRPFVFVAATALPSDRAFGPSSPVREALKITVALQRADIPALST
jgi:hypothetical protein